MQGTIVHAQALQPSLMRALLIGVHSHGELSDPPALTNLCSRTFPSTDVVPFGHRANWLPSHLTQNLSRAANVFNSELRSGFIPSAVQQLLGVTSHVAVAVLQRKAKRR